MVVKAEGEHELREREKSRVEDSGGNIDVWEAEGQREAYSHSKWRIVPLALATVWVGWGDGQNSHFSWTWLPATWKLIS